MWSLIWFLVIRNIPGQPMLAFITTATIVFFLLFIFSKEDRKTNTKLNNKAKLEQFLYTKYHYLRSMVWKKKRTLVFKRDNYRCQHCGSPNNLHCHHTSGYDKIPNEPISCLKTLCASCHLKEHEEKGFPQTYEDYMNWGN